MDALALLHTRNSAPKLDEPAPDRSAIDNMLQAALRAPDHAHLQPTRFLTVSGEARQQLGELFADAAAQRQPDLTVEKKQLLASKALRAPLIIVVIAKITEHPKVPEIEQWLTAGCAAQNILLAAHALGFAGIWRTGANAYDPVIEQGLGLAANEKIVGYLYLGTASEPRKSIPQPDTAEFCQPWLGR